MHSRTLVAAVAVKVVTLALLVLGATHPQWPQFAGKAMGARAVAYPLATLLLPICWALVRAHRRRAGAAGPRYPAVQDLLLSLPFGVDTGGNALDLYDRVWWFDDACHFLNWALLLGAVAASLSVRLGGWARLGLTVGLGSTTAIGWELGEYATFIRDSPEITTAYADTLGDLSLGTLGSLVAGLLALRLRRADHAG